MKRGKEKYSFYLIDGRLDLSMLNEEIEQDGTIDREKTYEEITLDLEKEYIADDISATLEEVAKIFEEDEKIGKVTEAFSMERMKEELKEFQMLDTDINKN